MMIKPDNTGLSRLLAAAGYSIKGLKACWQHEAAFRQELFLALIFLPLAFFLGETLTHQLLLISCCFLVVIAELINSAIEAIIDRIGPDIHPLSGQAKDIGSAVVFVSLLLFLTVWGLSIRDWLTQ